LIWKVCIKTRNTELKHWFEKCALIHENWIKTLIWKVCIKTQRIELKHWFEKCALCCLTIHNCITMHGTRNINFANAQLAKQIYQNKNIKEILYKTNLAATWNNETCRPKQLMPDYI
jgi:hypothetical protein